MTFDDWLQYGIDNAFCGKPHCYSHDVPEMDDDEAKEMDENGEVCITTIRLF